MCNGACIGSVETEQSWGHKIQKIVRWAPVWHLYWEYHSAAVSPGEAHVQKLVQTLTQGRMLSESSVP